MQTVEINGRCYNFEPKLRGGFIRISANEKEPYTFGDCLLFELLRDTGGAQYADLEAVTDAVYATDFVELINIISDAIGLKVEEETPENPTDTVSD